MFPVLWYMLSHLSHSKRLTKPLIGVLLSCNDFEMLSDLIWASALSLDQSSHQFSRNPNSDRGLNHVFGLSVLQNIFSRQIVFGDSNDDVD